MRIVVLTKYFGLNYTGATAATQHLISLWQENVASIDVVTLHVGDCLDFDKDTVTVERFSNISALNRRLNELGRADLYYSDDHLGTMLRGLHPFVHTYHGNWPAARWQSPKTFAQSLYFMPRYERIFKSCDTVVNVSSKGRVYTDKFARNSTVIHNGIMDLPVCVRNDSAGTRILAVGSVCRRKYEHLIPVARKIHELQPDAIIHVYGNIAEKDFSDALSALPNVELKSFCSRPPFWDYGALICTSASENLPISICEALACGTPVVSFDVGGIGEVVTERRGYLVNPFHSGDLAAKTVEAINRSDWDIDCEEVRREFSWERASERYLDLFAKLAGEAR